MSTQPTIADLEAETKRLARVLAALSIALNQGMPIVLAETMLSPVISRAQSVREIASFLSAQGVTDIYLRIEEPFSPEITDALAAGFNVPDDLSSLLENPHDDD
jgi:hypothetical protein